MSNVTIIPAQSGFTVIYADGDELSRGEPVIAWAIAAEAPNQGAMGAEVYPITPDGDPGTNYVGVENPDKTVNIVDGLFETLKDAQKARSRQSDSTKPSKT